MHLPFPGYTTEKLLAFCRLVQRKGIFALVTDIDKLLGEYPTQKMFDEMNEIYNILYPGNLPEY